jgi:hypothetical protein
MSAFPLTARNSGHPLAAASGQRTKPLAREDTAAESSASISMENVEVGRSGFLFSRMAHFDEEEFGLCCRLSRLSSLSLPLFSLRQTELMQLIPVPSVTTAAIEYMFLTV